MKKQKSAGPASIESVVEVLGAPTAVDPARCMATMMSAHHCARSPTISHTTQPHISFFSVNQSPDVVDLLTMLQPLCHIRAFYATGSNTNGICKLKF